MNHVYNRERVESMCAFLWPGRRSHRFLLEGTLARDHVSVSRTLCGALIFPSIASLAGRLLFQRVPSSLQRTVLVSAFFLGSHGDQSSAGQGLVSLSLNSAYTKLKTTDFQ